MIVIYVSVKLAVLQENGSLNKSQLLRHMDLKQMVVDRLTEAMKDDRNTFVVCLDLTWCDAMNKKVGSLQFL